MKTMNIPSKLGQHLRPGRNMNRNRNTLSLVFCLLTSSLLVGPTTAWVRTWPPRIRSSKRNGSDLMTSRSLHPTTKLSTSATSPTRLQYSVNEVQQDEKVSSSSSSLIMERPMVKVIRNVRSKAKDPLAEQRSAEEHSCQQQQNLNAIEQTLQHYNMPWKSSIDPSYEHENLFYMPFWEWQLSFMQQCLTDLRVIPTTATTATSCKNNPGNLAYIESGHHGHANSKTNKNQRRRMITLCFESLEYRYIRLTLVDGGNSLQVFTSLWYPRVANMPLLGIDSLQFHNQTRHLTVVDFQPVHESYNSINGDEDSKNPCLYNSQEPTRENSTIFDNRESLVDFEPLLKSIRRFYPSLQGKMSSRFYNETQFFSNQMLLGRETTPHYVWKELMPAYQSYVRAHLNLVQWQWQLHKQWLFLLQAPSSPSSQERHLHNYLLNSEYERRVLESHMAYDQYSAARDPAHGLLSSSFGKEYADAFVYGVLFPLSSNRNAHGGR